MWGVGRGTGNHGAVRIANIRVDREDGRQQIYSLIKALGRDGV